MDHNDTPQQSVTQLMHPNDIVRVLIEQAVTREVVNQIAPLRSQQQVTLGMAQQLNRDLGALGERLDKRIDTVNGVLGDLEELVRGNPRQNLVGLAEQIKAQSDVIEQVRKSLLALEEDRKALIHQWRGAKYALIGLGLLTSLPFLETLARFMGIFPV